MREHADRIGQPGHAGKFQFYTRLHREGRRFESVAAYQPSPLRGFGSASQPWRTARRLSRRLVRRSSTSEGGSSKQRRRTFTGLPHAIHDRGRSAEPRTANREYHSRPLCGQGHQGAPSGSPATALFDGIMETIGPSGTLVALAFTPDFYFWQKRQAARFPFHPKAKSDTGAFAQILLDHPVSVRSRHPTNSFVALGPNAEAIVDGHDGNSTSFYPIKNLIQRGGKLLLVGCVESSPGFSTVHRAPALTAGVRQTGRQHR